MKIAQFTSKTETTCGHFTICLEGERFVVRAEHEGTIIIWGSEIKLDQVETAREALRRLRQMEAFIKEKLPQAVDQ